MLDELLKSNTNQELLLNSNKNTKDHALIKESPTHKVISYFYKHLCAACNYYNNLPKHHIHREERAITVEQQTILSRFSSKYLPRSYLKELFKEKKMYIHPFSD